MITRSGWSRYRLWCVYHHRLCGASRKTGRVHWNPRSFIWMRQCYRSSTWRSIHIQSYLALVLLRQPTHWRCFCSCDTFVLSCACGLKARQSLMAGKDSSDGSTGHIYDHGRDYLLYPCTPMGWCDQSLERLIRHWDSCWLRLASGGLWTYRMVHG